MGTFLAVVAMYQHITRRRPVPPVRVLFYLDDYLVEITEQNAATLPAC